MKHRSMQLLLAAEGNTLHKSNGTAQGACLQMTVAHGAGACITAA